MLPRCSTSRLTDATMCINSINEFLFNRVVLYVSFNHVFCYCANTNIFYRPEWKFLEAGRLVTLDCLKGWRYEKG